MKRAELMVTLSAWSRDPSHHIVHFESVEEATSKFNEIAAKLKRRGDKGNDLPKFLDVEGINKLTCEFDSIVAIALIDLAKADEAEKGLYDEFPHVMRKR